MRTPGGPDVAWGSACTAGLETESKRAGTSHPQRTFATTAPMIFLLDLADA
jgi:hypothetical protein